MTVWSDFVKRSTFEAAGTAGAVRTDDSTTARTQEASDREQDASPAQMERAIKQECARADRDGREFSLVLFKADNCSRPSRQTRRLLKTIRGRVRLTDRVGWFNHNHVCAVLPNTPIEGARAFADGIADAESHRGQRPAAVVYSYPERKIAPDASTPAAAPGPLSSVDDLLVRPMPLWKRGLDLAGASVAILMAAPVMAAAALAIKLTSPGPVVFTQKRAGLGGRPFVIYKFRTMVTDAEAKKKELRKLSEQDGPAFKMKNDPRITKVGHFLRKTSIDELPQLFNVLKGDMSLVGPRPLPIDEANGCLQWQRRRLDITPGLTCIWQVEGRSTVSFSQWVRMDVGYARRRTPLHDISLILRTVPAVLLRRGAR